MVERLTSGRVEVGFAHWCEIQAERREHHKLQAKLLDAEKGIAGLNEMMSAQAALSVGKIRELRTSNDQLRAEVGRLECELVSQFNSLTAAITGQSTRAELAEGHLGKLRTAAHASILILNEQEPTHPKGSKAVRAVRSLWNVVAATPTPSDGVAHDSGEHSLTDIVGSNADRVEVPPSGEGEGSDDA